jgi:hypothetical protein
MDDQPFAERQFELGADTVTIRFNAPTLQPTGEFKCRYVIEWPDRIVRRAVYGIDGIQALMLAMSVVHSELVISEEYKSGRLTYLEGRDFDLPAAFD